MSTDLRYPSKGDSRLELFTPRSPEDIEASIRNGRMTSPVHWKYYFDFNPASLEIETKHYEFICLIDSNPEQATLLLKNLIAKKDKNSIVSCYDFLDRLEAELKNMLDRKDTLISLFRILSNVADDLSKQMGLKLPLEFDTFMRIEAISLKILKVIDSSERLSVILDVVENGGAFSWIMYFVRSLMIDHGIINLGDQTNSKWLSESELNKIRNKSLKRVNADTDKILDSSDPRHILYLWFDLGCPDDRHGLTTWVDSQIDSISGLIRFINVFRSIRTSEKGRTLFIQTKFLEKIANLEKIITRLKDVPSKDTDLKKQADNALSQLQASRM